MSSNGGYQLVRFSHQFETVKSLTDNFEPPPPSTTINTSTEQTQGTTYHFGTPQRTLADHQLSTFVTTPNTPSPVSKVKSNALQSLIYLLINTVAGLWLCS
jgi:hypothetical protein